jgi:hypothetical protein
LKKKIGIYVSLFFLISISQLQSQVDTLWTKTFGGSHHDLGTSVQQTTDGGYILTGWTFSFARSGFGRPDLWLIKTNTAGDTLWTKIFGKSGYDFGYSVQQSMDGGFIVTGSITYQSDEDVLLLKTNSLGDTLWTKIFEGIEASYGNSVQQTTDGGYIIVGGTFAFGSGGGDVWLIKTDENGDELWNKTFGGSSYDWGNSICQTNDGGYVITGTSYSFGSGENDVWLIKTDASGDTLWTKTYGDSEHDVGKSVQQTTDGGYIITGWTESFGLYSDSDVWLIKTDAEGNLLWEKTFGSASEEVGNSVQQTMDGGYVIVGSTDSFNAGGLWLIKTNELGDSIWTKTIGCSGDLGNSIKQTSDGGFIVVGGVLSLGAGLYDVWLVKTTADVSKIEPNSDMIALDFFLHQNYPNPFNPSTTIKYQIPELSFVTIKVYDVLGSEVAVLVNEEKLAGSYEVEFNTSALSSGMYFYRLQAENFVDVKKMILLK